MPPLYLLIKPASSLCNMRCEYCFYLDTAKNRETACYGIMSPETQEQMIARAFEYAAHSVTFAYQGGEPTLAGLAFFERELELAGKYNKRKLPVSRALQTNGLLLDEKWARFLAENNYLVGLSLDGPADIHDRARPDAAGKGSFSRVMRAAKLMEKHNVQYNILSVVGANAAAHIRSVYGFFRKNGFDYLQFIPALDPIGGGHEKWSLTPELFARYMKNLFDAWYDEVTRGGRVFVRTFDNYVRMLAGFAPESCGMSGVCARQHVVEADGSVYPCDFYVLDGCRLGSVHTDSFYDIDAACDALGFIEESKALPEKCRSCEYFALCRGGCKRMRAMDAELGCPALSLCEGYKEFFAYALDGLESLSGNWGCVRR